MIEYPAVEDGGFSLDDYEGIAHLSQAVRDLRREAEAVLPRLRGRTVWMVNSTAHGGGVAEMLPRMVTLLNDLGLRTRWAVFGTEVAEFFALTKNLHNLIHGEGDPALTDEDRQLYDSVNAENAAAMLSELGRDDIVVIHDPQPMGMGRTLQRDAGVRTIWRCHIGLDEQLPTTRAAWNFLRPYAAGFDRAVFTAPEYIPDFFAGRSSTIYPSLDPESHKNRELKPHKLTGILCNAGLKTARHPVLTPAFEEGVRRLDIEGNFVPAANGDEIGLLYRPVISQVSRWDRLKGFAPLIDGFAAMKRRRNGDDPRHDHRREIVRLVLAGPDPSSVQDDPEGLAVLQELCDNYVRLPRELQNDVALLVLPMGSRKDNALMVNALQRCSTVVLQNSLREGFGLTATEAMWKGLPVLGTRACGLRIQIRDRIDGLLVDNPLDSDEIAEKLDGLLMDPRERDELGRSAQRRVHQEFLIFTQLRNWLRLIDECVGSHPG